LNGKKEDVKVFSSPPPISLYTV